MRIYYIYSLSIGFIYILHSLALIFLCTSALIISNIASGSWNTTNIAKTNIANTCTTNEQ